MLSLDAYLRENNVSVEAFAAIVGVSRMSVYRWRNGESFPKRDQLQRIIRATNGRVSADSFLLPIGEEKVA